MKELTWWMAGKFRRHPGRTAVHRQSVFGGCD